MNALLIKRIRVYTHEAIYRLRLPLMNTAEYEPTINAVDALKRRHGCTPGEFLQGVWYHVVDEDEENAKMELVRMGGGNVPLTYPVEVGTFEAFCRHENLDPNHYLSE